MGRLLFALCLITGLTGCGGGPGDTQGGPSVLTYSVQLAWNGSKETAVNRPGGGYRVYYAKSAGFAASDATTLDVPFSGTATPTKATVTGLEAGQYFFRIVAFSALNPPGGSAGSTSAPSTEATLTVP